VVSLALTKDWEVEAVESLYEGMEQCAMAYGCTLVGGDTVKSKGGCSLTVTILGDVKEDKIVTRDGAQEGDLLCMTGEMGGARVGLEVLKSGEDEKRYADSVNRFLEPKPRLWEAKRLANELAVSSMIDISDGLASEIGHLCKQSHLGCLVDEQKIPAAGEVIRWVDENKEPLSRYLLESGEEYELLFTVSEERYEKWQEKKLDVDLKITVIGEMVDKREGIRIKSEGKARSITTKGWDHFGERGSA
jgi:thiamine-monophosphate kinase